MTFMLHRLEANIRAGLCTAAKMHQRKPFKALWSLQKMSQTHNMHKRQNIC